VLLVELVAEAVYWAFVPLLVSALKKERRWRRQQRHESGVGRRAKYPEAVRVDGGQLLGGEPKQWVGGSCSGCGAGGERLLADANTSMSHPLSPTDV